MKHIHLPTIAVALILIVIALGLYHRFVGAGANS